MRKFVPALNHEHPVKAVTCMIWTEILQLWDVIKYKMLLIHPTHMQTVVRKCLWQIKSIQKSKLTIHWEQGTDQIFPSVVISFSQIWWETSMHGSYEWTTQQQRPSMPTTITSHPQWKHIHPSWWLFPSHPCFVLHLRSCVQGISQIYAKVKIAGPLWLCQQKCRNSLISSF